MLVKVLDYSRQLAEFIPGFDPIADPPIEFADEDTTLKIWSDLIQGAAGGLIQDHSYLSYYNSKFGKPSDLR
jgi:hypothetical protein